MVKTQKWLIGVDEAGRGPLAGPVAVGVVVVSKDFNWSCIEGVGDSKKVSPKNREMVFKRALQLQKEGKLDFKVVLVSAKTIDAIGIVPSIIQAIDRALLAIEKAYLVTSPRTVLGEVGIVKLDGGLKAPERYIQQETIIKGDSKEKVIGLASILAKVTRDRYMVQKSTESIFAPYGFDIHKGYGTKVHRELIQKNGLSIEHRKSFCKRFIPSEG